MSLFQELQRRKVIRVGIAYLALAWLGVQVAETLLPAHGFTHAALQTLVAVLAVGFVLTLLLAWIFDWTAGGLQVTASADVFTDGIHIGVISRLSNVADARAERQV